MKTAFNIKIILKTKLQNKKINLNFENTDENNEEEHDDDYAGGDDAEYDEILISIQSYT